MSLRWVALVVAFVALTAGVLFVAFQNQEVLESRILFWGESDLTVWSSLLCSFFIGFAVAFGLSTLRSSQLVVGRLRDARGARRRDRAERLYGEGLQAVLAERPERAEERFREGLEIDPDHYATLMSYGELLRSSGRAREAADLHRRASQQRPGDIRSLFAIAADWRADGDVDQARGAFERVISTAPKESTRARRALRDLLMENERWEEARVLQEKLVPLARDDAGRERERRVALGIRFEIGRAAQERGELKEAEREFRALLKLAPDFAPASLALGEVLIAGRDPAAGVKEWRRGLDLTESPVFLSRLEEHHLAAEQPEQILEIMRVFVGTARSRAVPAFYLGKLYLRLEMIDDAEAMFSSIEEYAPDSLLLRYFRAKIQERRGDLKQAAAGYRLIIKDAELFDLSFRCRHCDWVLSGWTARCPSCGEWGSVDVQLRGVGAEVERRLVPRPEWAAAP